MCLNASSGNIYLIFGPCPHVCQTMKKTLWGGGLLVFLSSAIFSHTNGVLKKNLVHIQSHMQTGDVKHTPNQEVAL